MFAQPYVIQPEVRLDPQSKQPPRFKLKGNMSNVMSDADAAPKVADLIDQLHTQKQQQDIVDRWYEQFTEAYYSEMRKFFRELGDSPKSKKNARLISKPWWNDHLTDLRKKVHTCDKRAHRHKKHKKTIPRTTERS